MGETRRLQTLPAAPENRRFDLKLSFEFRSAMTRRYSKPATFRRPRTGSASGLTVSTL